MSRPLAHPSPRTPLATAAPARGWFARLAPLAISALLGCGADDQAAVGIGDEASTTADDTTADDTTADDTAADDTADLAAPGDDPLDRIATECEQRFTCDCPADRFVDAAACEAYYRIDWIGVEAKAQAAGLTADFECYMRWMPYESYGCDSQTEYAEHGGWDTCSFCQYGYGDRQVGESCQDFGDGLGSCAQGLLCHPDAQGEPRCIDPCSQAGAGETCNYLACADGLLCDWVDMTCHPVGDEGEACLDGQCNDGLICDPQTYTCTQAAGLGEPCENWQCAPDLYCDGQVCAAPASQGEDCTVVPCGPGLVCRWDDSTCDAPAQAGEKCVGSYCADPLLCNYTLDVCAPPSGVGGTCLDWPCLDGLTCDYQTMTCAGPPELGEPCVDYCANELLCNYMVEPVVCVARPVGGEPCVLDTCAANFLCDPKTQVCVDEPAMLCNL